MSKLCRTLSGVLITLILTSVPVFAFDSEVYHYFDLETEFTDLPGDALYYDAVTLLEDLGIVVGYTDGTFGYDKAISRAELLKIALMGRFFQPDADPIPAFADEGCFDDVPAGEWFTGYICYAVSEGYVAGYADGNFRPNQNINFVEAMKIVLKVNDVDYPETEIWYRGIVDTAAAYNGIPLTITDFDQIISRSEMSDMVVRRFSYDVGELEDFLGDRIDYGPSYDSIEGGLDQYLQYLDQRAFSDSLVDPLWIFNLDGDSIMGLGDPMGTEYFDFTSAPGFQNTFRDVYRSFSDAILVDGYLYFSNDFIFGDIGSNVVRYDPDLDIVETIYEREMEENVVHLWGIDTNEDLLIVTFDAPDFSPGSCYNPWVDNEYMYSLSLSDATLMGEYYVPFWKKNQEVISQGLCFDDL